MNETRPDDSGEEPGACAQRAHEESVKKESQDSKGPADKARRFERRREKIREEIARNRRGEYTVPTWVLVVILVALVGGWIAVVVLA